MQPEDDFNSSLIACAVHIALPRRMESPVQRLLDIFCMNNVDGSSFFFFLSFFFLFFFRVTPVHVEVPRVGAESEL